MKIGIGLPNNVVGVPGPLMVEWARRAEQRGFESVTTIDRLIYPSLDSIIALALAAGATTELTLVTNILLAPLYPPAILAKQLASLALARATASPLGSLLVHEKTITPQRASTSTYVAACSTRK